MVRLIIVSGRDYRGHSVHSQGFADGGSHFSSVIRPGLDCLVASRGIVNSRSRLYNHRSMTVKARSFAKINLGLRIGTRRSDGFHELLTIYQTIGLHDMIDVSI